jgi:hypothetical protein
MSFRVTVHYDNAAGFALPHVVVHYPGVAALEVFAATGADSFGAVYALEVLRSHFGFRFKDGPGLVGRWEDAAVQRSFTPIAPAAGAVAEAWCSAEHAFVYPLEPPSTTGPRGAGREHACDGHQSPELAGVASGRHQHGRGRTADQRAGAENGRLAPAAGRYGESRNRIGRTIVAIDDYDTGFC